MRVEPEVKSRNAATIFMLLILAAAYPSCDKRSLEPKRPDFIALSAVSMPDTIWLGTDDRFRISAVQADRLVNAGAISAVQVAIENEAGAEAKRITLYDDGLDGDLIAKDGIFSRYFTSAGFVESPGKYDARFLPDAGDNNSIISHIFTGLAGKGNSAPELFNLRIPRSISYDQKFVMNLLTLDV